MFKNQSAQAHQLVNVEHLFAGKPQAFGSRGAPSSIIKQAHRRLNITKDGAVEDEQGNKKLHGGPQMAIHQYAQKNYIRLKSAFPNTKVPFSIGTIGENISAANMHDGNVYIGDKYQIGEVILEVVSPRAPCSKINHRYGQAKIDAFIAENNLTGWYYSVTQAGIVEVGDHIHLVERQAEPISVEQIWQLRKLLKASVPVKQHKHWLSLASRAFDMPALAAPWQADMHRVACKLEKM